MKFFQGAELVAKNNELDFVSDADHKPEIF